MSRQPAPTVEILRNTILEYPSWKLAGSPSFFLPLPRWPHRLNTSSFLRVEKKKAFERAVYTTKSFFIALALVQGKLTVEQAALASHVEVDSQIEVWGEVEDSPFPFLALSFYSECLNHSVDITFPLGICFIQLTMWTTRMSVDNLEA